MRNIWTTVTFEYKDKNAYNKYEKWTHDHRDNKFCLCVDIHNARWIHGHKWRLEVMFTLHAFKHIDRKMAVKKVGLDLHVYTQIVFLALLFASKRLATSNLYK